MTPLDPLKLLTIRLPLSPLSLENHRLLERYKVGGICLFRGEYTRLTDILDLLERLFDLLGPQTLISVDQEGGSVVRLPQLPTSPGGFALSSANDPDLTYAVAHLQARALRLCGFNVNFAPLLDINNNPRNPVIADRALGITAEGVIRHALPFLKAHQDAGILAVGKHFPGHGDTLVDSHYGLPVLDKDFDQLEALELKPYRAAFDAGLEAVMTAHIVFPRLSSKPATLSPEILGYLRQNMNFDGLVFTDALDMKAVVGESPPWEVALDALEAGADNLLVLDSATLEQTFERFQPTSHQMKASLERFERTVQKYPFKPPQREELSELLSKGRSSIVSVARKAVTARGVIPALKAHTPTLFLIPPNVRGGGANDSDSIGARLREEVGKRLEKAVVLEYDPENPDLDELESELQWAEVIIFVTVQRTTMQGGQIKIAQRLKTHVLDKAAHSQPNCATSRGGPPNGPIRPNAVHANLWNPFLSLELPTVSTFGFSEASVQALIYALEQAAFPGTFEVNSLETEHV